MHAHAALNRIYRLVWSALHQTWVVASELARGRGKSNATSLISAALLASLASLSGGAGAAPQGGQVVSGSGSISAGQSTTTITQASDKLSINWQSFNVAKAETVNFVQPSASALAVNRILDTQGSQILGKINANGQVWLINPNGVLFGRDAQINVGGLLASTLNPDDASIGSARSNFSGNSTAGVVNLGSINAAQGGYVALLGHSVSNQGSISAPGGTVALGAGSAVSLNFAGSKLLGLEVTSNQVNALAENGGLIQADGGQVLLSAGARESLLASVVNNTGVIRADSVSEHNGKIVLSGGGSGVVRLAGTLSATGTAAGQTGGTVQVLGDKVLLAPGANIDASGQSGGGTVLVGGDYQGSNASVQNASRVYVASDTSLKADATGDGNGGKVVVWADGDTRFAGSISARGGTQGGNGGFVEVSGKEHLDMRGQIDVAAPQGTGGKVLLDPRDIVLNATAQGSPPSNSDTPDVAFDDAPADGIYTIEVVDITGYSELHLQATNNITVNSAVTMGAGNSIRLEANNNIAVNAGIRVTGVGSINLWADADSSGVGNVVLTSAALSAEAGGITLRGASVTGTGANSTIGSTGAANGNAGNISIRADTGDVALAANVAAIGGTKGAGGNIWVSAAGTLSTGGAAITSSGGAGSTSAGGNAGNITLSGGTVTLGASQLRATGGAGNGTSFAGGSGGAISVTSNAGGMTSTGAGAMTANGGAASSTGAAAGGAAGTITVTNDEASTGAISLAGTGGLSARTGSSVGTTAALAAGSITVSNNATAATAGATTLAILNTAGQANGNGGAIRITTTGTLSLTTVHAGGGTVNAFSSLDGRSAGNVTINTGAAITALQNINDSGSAGVGANQAGGAGGVVSITTVKGIAGAAITASGGAGSTTNGSGGAAGTITVVNSSTGAIGLNNLTARAGAAVGAFAGGAAGSISVTNNASGGNVTVGAISTAGNANGNGGQVNITTTGTLSVGTIGTGGGAVNTGSSQDGRSAGNVTINTGAAITALGAITASGTAGVGTNQNGGAGGEVSVTTISGITGTAANITASGGAAVGTGTGGNAGRVVVSNSGSGNLTLGALTVQTGNASANTASAAGSVNATSSISVTNNFSGGNVTTAALTTTGGTKGAGGNITVSAAGSGILSTGGAAITSTGGVGSTSAGANAGNITVRGGTVTLGASALTATGGAGNGTSFAGGSGGAISVTSNAGGMTSTGAGAMTANGGAASSTGGAAAGGAAGTVTVTSDAASTGAINLAGALFARTGASTGTTAALAAGSITVSNNATARTATTLGAISTAGNANGNGGGINITATGTVALGSIAASNGAGGTQRGDVTILAGDAITQTGSIVTGHLSATTAKAGGAAITLTAQNNDAETVNLQVRNGSVAAVGTENANAAISYTDANTVGVSGINNGTGGTAGTVTLLAGGALTQSGAIKASTLTATTANTGGAAITLTNTGNDATFVNLQARKGSVAAIGAANAGAAISYTDATGFEITGINNGTGGTVEAVTLVANGAVTQSGAITATGLALTGTGGAYTLNHESNAITTLAANTGSVSYKQSTALAVGEVGAVAGVTTTGTTKIETTGADANLTLDKAVTSKATGDAIILKAGSSNLAGASTGGQLINNVLTGGIVASSGRYLVYSGDPGSTTEGVTGYAKRYNANATFVPSVTDSTDSTFYYRIAPTLAITANAGSKVYDGAAPTLTFGTTGLIDGDTAGTALTGALTRTGGKNVLGGDAVTIGTIAAQMGYRITTYGGADFSINKAALIVTANKAGFNTGNTPTGLSGTVSGFVNNESQSSATTGTLAWTTPATNASGAGSYAINGSGLSADNYSFSQAVGNATALTLTQSVSIVPVVKPPSLSSDTSFVKPAPLPQASLPFNVAENINTLPATAAGSAPSTSLNVTKAFGSSGMLFAQGNGVRLPATYYQPTLADPAQNP